MDGGMKEADEGALYTHREEGHPPDPCLSLPSGNRKGPISSATLFRDKEFRRLAIATQAVVVPFLLPFYPQCTLSGLLALRFTAVPIQ